MFQKKCSKIDKRLFLYTVKPIENSNHKFFRKHKQHAKADVTNHMRYILDQGDALIRLSFFRVLTSEVYLCIYKQ